ncbi:hypothetical protein K440DRAFT_608996 [Wilcoxina mikolae CBS 423.85]|nr:hypothetical protein K440DRAFT_608996 [Wilcoxina mikolae CBS 423.85]
MDCEEWYHSQGNFMSQCRNTATRRRSIMSVTTALPLWKRIPPTAGRTAKASGRLCQVLVVSETMPSTVV